ncbi:hypothetical protein Fot_14864 [Forsythia ovata]|uniref:Uncharacterized protein n=1 Tax=Forsythia ovata TaxID=205694 RepID=A0ABD1W7W5_9LAMI
MNFNRAKKNPSSNAKVPSKLVQTKLPLKPKGPPPAKEVVITEPSLHSCKTTVAEVVEKSKRLKEEVIQQRKAVEKLELAKKNPEVEKLCSNVRQLMLDLKASRVSTAVNEETLLRQLEDKNEEINMLRAQQKSWDEGLALKDEKLGLFTNKVDAKSLSLAKMTSQVKALRKELLNYKESDEGK